MEMKWRGQGKAWVAVAGGVLLMVLLAGCLNYPREVKTNPAVETQRMPHLGFEHKIRANADELFEQGREIFRYDTFGSEAFWGDEVGLHKAILGEKHGGVGPGLTPKQALEL